MSSVNARVAIPNQVPYCVSKGGVDQLTKVMALSLSPYGIRVNAIGPGSIMTDILKGVATDKAAQQRLLSRTPLGRIGDPDEIASVAAFLACEGFELHDRRDDLCRRRAARAQLHGAGEGGVAAPKRNPRGRRVGRHPRGEYVPWLLPSTARMSRLRRYDRAPTRHRHHYRQCVKQALNAV